MCAAKLEFEEDRLYPRGVRMCGGLGPSVQCGRGLAWAGIDGTGPREDGAGAMDGDLEIPRRAEKRRVAEGGGFFFPAL